MLNLPNIILICVDTVTPNKALIALENSCKDIQFGRVMLLHSKDFELPECPIALQHILEVEEIDSFDSVDNWSKFIFYNIHEYVKDNEFVNPTTHILLIHPDGYVINSNSWRDEFLSYDFCGAPFYPGIFKDSKGDDIRVGNSVSIRSKKLLELPSKLGLEWNNSNEDTAICVDYRDQFLAEGITYAPLEVAKYFSKENNIPEQIGIENTFCFHKRRVLQFLPENTYIGYVNLDSRSDRNEHITRELEKAGITADRQRGILPEEVSLPPEITNVILNRTKGALGCWMSQISIMEEALKQGKHAIVFEDDVVFCDDFQERLKKIELFLTDNEWDIFWLGGTYHIEPTWHKRENGKHTHPDLQMCECDKDCDWEPTTDPQIVRTYGCWSTYAYIVNHTSIKKILERLQDNLYRSMGIDWYMILAQPQLHTYAFNPGCTKQFDNQSNIGNDITYFSVFENLGPHWYKDKM